MMTETLWLTPLILLPGVTLLVMSTPIRWRVLSLRILERHPERLHEGDHLH